MTANGEVHPPPVPSVQPPSRKPKCLLIGLGRRATEDYLPALAESHRIMELTAVCDPDKDRERPALDEYQNLAPQSYPRPHFYTDVAAALANEELDFAIIVTPHHTHFELAQLCLERNLAVLKEKPYALDVAEAEKLTGLITQTDGYLRLCVQRQQHPLYLAARRALPYLGQVRHFTAWYQLSVPSYSQSWRGNRAHSGGGALIDMGYHYVDLLHWFFAMPTHVHAAAAPNKDVTLDGQVEQTIVSTWCYPEGHVGTVFISTCEPNKEEYLTIAGTLGFMSLKRDELRRFNEQNTEVEVMTRTPGYPSSVGPTLHDFVQGLEEKEATQRQECARGVAVTTIIDMMYCSMAEHRTVDPSDVR